MRQSQSLHHQQCVFCQGPQQDKCKNCQHSDSCQHCPTCKLLQAKNQPIPIRNEHELAHLYLQDFYKKQPTCNILTLDAGAILNIMSKAECFSDAIKKQAVKVRDNVRNKWAHAVINEWSTTRLNVAFMELTKLAQMMPNSGGLIQELNEDLTGIKTLEFPKKDFLLKINQFRTSVKSGDHFKIQEKIQRLENSQNQEIYLERKFRECTTGQVTSEAEDLVLSNATTLLKGEAGAGKSSVAAKAVQQWSVGKHLKDITCCLFLTAGSEIKVPLNKTIWDDYSDSQKWTDTEAKEVFKQLQILADEGKLAIVIDGLDELGTITRKDLYNASRAASHTSTEVDMKTTCAGILSKNILSGAKVLATGRNTEIVNTETLGQMSSMWALEDLTNSDRERLIQLMESNPMERKLIEKELNRIDVAGNDYFLKTPLMTKIVIQLCSEKLIDIKQVTNSSEIFLMVILKNLQFHANLNTNFTELDPPEYHDFLEKCLKMCQIQIQTAQNIDTVHTIAGIQRNIQNVGQCFETKMLGETIRIPLDFINKLGIFEYRKAGGKAYLDAVHLTFFEFCCAGSLCRDGVNIPEELSKIKDPARFKAVVTYLAGMFADNSNIEFLTICKNLCQNFLDLLDHPDREKSLEDTFKSILLHPLTKSSSDIVFTEESGENTRTWKENIPILVQALKASQHQMKMKVVKVSLKRVNKWSDFHSLVQLIELQQDDIEHLDAVSRGCGIEHDTTLMKLLKKANTWNLHEPFNEMNIGGRHLDSLEFGTTTCWESNDVRKLCGLLAAVAVWRLDVLVLFDANQKDWAALAKEAKRGSIGTVKVTTRLIKLADEEDLRLLWASTDPTGWVIWGGSSSETGYVKKPQKDDNSGLRKLLEVRLEEEFTCKICEKDKSLLSQYRQIKRSRAQLENHIEAVHGNDTDDIDDEEQDLWVGHSVCRPSCNPSLGRRWWSAVTAFCCCGSSRNNPINSEMPCDTEDFAVEIPLDELDSLLLESTTGHRVRNHNSESHSQPPSPIQRQASRPRMFSAQISTCGYES